jgi:hypothetical protein
MPWTQTTSRSYTDVRTGGKRSRRRSYSVNATPFSTRADMEIGGDGFAPASGLRPFVHPALRAPEEFRQLGGSAEDKTG